MQIAELAPSLINSLWVHGLPVNKDLGAFEWRRPLSGQRLRGRELGSNFTVKASQDTKQPPSRRPDPPDRNGTERAPLPQARKRRQRRAAPLCGAPSPPPEPHMTDDWRPQQPVWFAGLSVLVLCGWQTSIGKVWIFLSQNPLYWPSRSAHIRNLTVMGYSLMYKDKGNNYKEYTCVIK